MLVDIALGGGGGGQLSGGQVFAAGHPAPGVAGGCSQGGLIFTFVGACKHCFASYRLSTLPAPRDGVGVCAGRMGASNRCRVQTLAPCASTVWLAAVGMWSSPKALQVIGPL